MPHESYFVVFLSDLISSQQLGIKIDSYENTMFVVILNFHLIACISRGKILKEEVITLRFLVLLIYKEAIFIEIEFMNSCMVLLSLVSEFKAQLT